MTRAADVLAAGLLSSLVACSRPPIPAEQDQYCEATCISFACINPELDDDVIERCNSYCTAKLDASIDQGPECEVAFAEAIECLAELSCQEYSDWALLIPDGPCPLARASVASACEQIYLEPHALPP